MTLDCGSGGERTLSCHSKFGCAGVIQFGCPAPGCHTCTEATPAAPATQTSPEPAAAASTEAPSEAAMASQEPKPAEEKPAPEGMNLDCCIIQIII